MMQRRRSAFWRYTRAVLNSTALAPLARGVVVALPVAVGALCIETSAALADGGASGYGTPGGVDQATTAGGDGSTDGTSYGGGGGGAGVSGGSGGNSSSINGLGGSGPGASGLAGHGGSGGQNGGGGGGGAHGFTGATPPSGAVVGGNGGNGGDSQNYAGGGGGAGGWGAVLTGSGDLGALAVTVSGGTGGDGGAAPAGFVGHGSFGNGGYGGSGGIGLALVGSAPSLTINAIVIGGNGGQGGSASSANNGGVGGNGGSGGSGISAASAALTINAAVTGGTGGTGGDSGNVGNAGSGGRGGRGGNGGVGLALTGSTVIINAAVTGGNAGNGGNANVNHATGGGGGDGGAGISGMGTAITIGTSGSVTGGSFGIGGQGQISNGSDGASGVGISGSDLTVINAGSITGGSGANAITFTGGSNVLELRSGFTISGNVVGTGSDTFRLGGSTNASFDVSAIGPSAQYQGFATFEKTGNSHWTLTGTNTAVLPWTINAGTLVVDGNLANSTFTVNSNAALAGSGTVGNVTVAGGGWFGPGDTVTPGTSITVSGNLALQSGATYFVVVDPAAASFANVTGTATLGGNVLAGFYPGTYLARQYTILHSAGLGGTTFAGLSTPALPTGFTASLSYTSTDVLLNLTAVLGTHGASGLGGNQQGVVNTLNNFFNNGGTLPPNFLTVFGLTGGNLSAALSQLSGEVSTGSQRVAFNAMTQFLGVLTDPVAGRGDGFGSGSSATGYADESDQTRAYASRRAGDAFAMFTKAPATYLPRWSVWASGFGGGQSISGNAAAGTNDTTSRIAGAAVGADYRFSPDTIAGFALAGGGTSFGVSNLSSGRSDLFQAGAYMRHSIGAAYVTGALAYGWQDVTTTRNVTIAGLDVLQARFNANTLSGRLEGGYRFVVPVIGGLGVTPYAAAQVTTIWLPSYAEQAVTGNNTFALAYGGKTVPDPRSEIGVRTDKSYALSGAVLTLRGRQAWMHDFNPDQSVGATFTALPGASFVVNGAAQPRDAWLSTAAAEVKFVSGWAVAASLDSQWAPHATSYSGKGSVRYQW
jgi:uncharacterized protein with beta-barrel porin domain